MPVITEELLEDFGYCYQDFETVGRSRSADSAIIASLLKAKERMAAKQIFKDDVSLEEVQELVRMGKVDLKETDCDGNNILHKVCSLNKDKSEIVEYLVGAGAAVNQVNRERCTPLILCAGRGYLDTLRVLIRHHGCVNPHGAAKGHDSALIAAARNVHEACVHELVKHGADIWYHNEKGEHLLFVACKAGLASVVKYCLDDGNEMQMRDTRVHVHGLSPFQQACEKGHIECLRLLLSSSTYMKSERSVDKYYEKTYRSRKNILLEAASNKHEECVLELLSSGANICYKDCQEKSVFFIAASQGLVKVLRECLNRLDSDEIRQSDSKGRNAITLACENNQYGCLKELLESKKFPPEALNQLYKGITPLMLCAHRGHTECLKLLIHHKADVEPPLIVSGERRSYSDEAIGRTGDSAILSAAKSKNEDCVKVLIDAGADIWNKNSEGQNLLMVASMRGLVDTVKYCLSNSKVEQITLVDTHQMNALTHAYKNYQVKCLKVLLGVGRNVSDVLMLATKGKRGNLLHSVCEETVERPEIVELLVSNSSLVDSVNARGCTPLMVSAQRGHLETLKVLLSHGASIDAVQTYSENIPSFKVGKAVPVRNTALLMAAEAGHEECVVELMVNGADVWYQNNHGTHLLSVASSRGLLSVIKKCLGMFTDNDKKKWYCVHGVEALLAALENSNENCALEIMEYSMNEMKKIQSALLTLACSKGMARVARNLLGSKECKFDIGSKNAALLEAVMNKREDCALELIAHGADILCTNDTHNVLASAAEELDDDDDDDDDYDDDYDDDDDIDIGLDIRKKVSWPNERGRNCLMLAAGEGLVEVVRVCGDKLGSDDINKKDKAGKSALFHAVFRGCVDTVKELLRCGADPSLIDPLEMLSLAEMSMDRDSELSFCELINHGSDFTGVNKYGENTLMIAVKIRWHQLVKVIIEKSEEPFLTMANFEGKNAMWYAIDIRDWLCVEELLKSPKCSEMRATALKKCPAHSREGRELIQKYCLGMATPSRVSINTREPEMLHMARSRTYYSESDISELLDDGIDVWHTDANGQNLLMIAVTKGMTRVVRFCVAKASHQQIHAVDKKGKTAIMIACDKCVHSLGYFTVDTVQELDCLLEILENAETFKRQVSQEASKFTDIDAQIYGDNESLLHFVCDTNEDRADIVSKLIQKGASVNQYNKNGFTPLMACARKNNIKCLSVLLKHGANVHASSRSAINIHRKKQKNRAVLQSLVGDTSLHLAAMYSHEACVKLLIEHGADIWCCNDRGQNLLMISASRGQWSIVRHCLDRGSPDQINKLDKDGNNAVIHACRNAQVTSLVFLLENKHSLLQINTRSVKLGMSPLMVAVNFRCLEAVRILLQKGADPNYTNHLGVTCLLMAVGKNPRDHTKEPSPSRQYFKNNPAFLDFVTILLEFGAHVNYDCRQTRETALTVAAKVGVHATIMEKLLEHGADVNQSDARKNIPLLSACENGQGNVIELLLSHGANVNKASKLTGKSLLLEAVSQGVSPQAVKMLIDHGACVNQVDSHGNTALLNACRNSQERVIDQLLQNEADVNICSKSGDSPLLLAVQGDTSIEVIRELLKHGAYINKSNKDNYTALLKACEKRKQDAVKLLLQHGATPKHACAVSGNTALISAVRNDFELDIVKDLIKNGSDVNHANKGGETAIKMSCMKRNLRLVKLLLKHGASVAHEPIGRMGYPSSFTVPGKKLFFLAGTNVSGEHNPASPGEGTVPRLFDLCRIPARQHVMKCFPDSNLFHTVPRLVLPSKMKRFLLHDYDIDDNDAQIPDLNTTDGHGADAATRRNTREDMIRTLLFAQAIAQTNYDDYYDSDHYFPTGSYGYYHDSDDYYDSDW